MKKHYCFSTSDSDVDYLQRIHVPIANECKLGCIYCDYIETNNIGHNLIKPGTCSELVVGKKEIREYLDLKLKKDTGIVGISGPGDPLISTNQFKIFQDVYKEINMNLELCVCTSGYGFDKALEIIDLKDIKYITFTINSLNPETNKKIYRMLDESNNEHAVLIDNQMNGIDYFNRIESEIKVNTVFLPGINDVEISEMFLELKRRGVKVFNLLKCDNSEEYLSKYNVVLNEIKCRGEINLLTKCLRCKSDSCNKL